MRSSSPVSLRRHKHWLVVSSRNGGNSLPIANSPACSGFDRREATFSLAGASIDIDSLLMDFLQLVLHRQHHPTRGTVKEPLIPMNSAENRSRFGRVAQETDNCRKEFQTIDHCPCRGRIPVTPSPPGEERKWHTCLPLEELGERRCVTRRAALALWGRFGWCARPGRRAARPGARAIPTA